LIDCYDLGPLLVFPEHRLIWQALVRTRARLRATDPGAFFAAWLDDLRDRHPDHWTALVDLTMCADREGAAGWHAYEPMRDDGLPRYAVDHGFDWWLARLRNVAERRRLVGVLYQGITAAWSDDSRFSTADAMRMLRTVEADTATAQRPRSIVAELDV
jgi:hypothetical protein